MNRSSSWIVVPLTVLLLGACNFPGRAPELPHRNPTNESPLGCGDGDCKSPENAELCPEDCFRTETDEPSYEQVKKPVVYLGLMVHLEGWKDHTDRDRFERHAELVRLYADLFERYGAKLTLESKEMTEGILTWGDNVLAEMENRGHGIGVHADIGGQRNYECANFVNDLRRERIQLEKLGVQVRHVSGNTSHCDWVEATIKAGYEFTTGNVAYSVMSMPPESRPEAYRDCPDPSHCHQTFPEALEDRLHPWRTSDGRAWLTHDPDGQLVILPSSQVLPCMAEEIEGGEFRGCIFDDRDLELFEQELKRAIALADPEGFNQFYVAWSLGEPLDEQMTERWLKLVQPYVQSGEVVWATLPEIYDAYLIWEAGS
jgi:hypothetical protein